MWLKKIYNIYYNAINFFEIAIDLATKSSRDVITLEFFVYWYLNYILGLRYYRNISLTVVYMIDEDTVAEKKKIRLRGTVIVNLRETTKIEVNSL